jgi:hypothetical protein
MFQNEILAQVLIEERRLELRRRAQSPARSPAPERRWGRSRRR